MLKQSRSVLCQAIKVRKLHAPSASIDINKVEEIRIPVPWGHVAGKWWGDQNTQPIIAAHGLLDNAGTFDTLIPRLNVNSVLCLDLIGHGLSSHSPAGQTFALSNNLLLLRYILKKHFNWEKLTLLGHSFGSIIFFCYSGLYPEDVEKMINLDCARGHVVDRLDNIMTKSRTTYNNTLKYITSNKDSPEYSYDECIQKMYNSRLQLQLPVTAEACKILAKRGVYNLGNGKFKFSHDPSIKFNSLAGTSPSYYEAISKKVDCRVLNITMTKGVQVGPLLDELNKQLNFMKINCKQFDNFVIEGGHHAHLEIPEAIAPNINNFLNS